MDPDPTMKRAVKNFNLKDWSVIAVGTFTGYGFGFLTGSIHTNFHFLICSNFGVNNQREDL